jgi:hypothetical protein
MCLTLSKKFYLILLFWVRYKITRWNRRRYSNSKNRWISTLRQHVSSNTAISNRCLAVDHWKRLLFRHTSQSSQLSVWRSISNKQFTAWAINLHKYWRRLNLLNEKCFKWIIENDQDDQRKESKFDEELQWLSRCN